MLGEFEISPEYNKIDYVDFNIKRQLPKLLVTNIKGLKLRIVLKRKYALSTEGIYNAH
jgi:hypothetical protein